MSVDSDSQKKIADLIFRREVEYIDVSVYIENELFDTFLEKNNVTVNSTFAMPPYHTFVWVNDAGMNIHKMDYRFQMWSLGTLIPSVNNKVNFNLTYKHQGFGNRDVQKLNAEQMYKMVYQVFRDTLIENNPSSRFVLDYSYLCHRYERYTPTEKCLASKCFMFNDKNYFYEHDSFCADNVNSFLLHQISIWVFLFILFFSYLPLIVFWLHKEPTEGMNTSKPKHQPAEQQPTSQQVTDQQRNAEVVIEMGQQPSAEQQTTEQPSSEQQTTEQPSAEQQTTEQPSAEQQTTEQPSAEQQTTEQPSAEQQTTEQPSAEQQTTEQPSAEQQTPEQPSAEQQTAEQPSADQQITEQQLAEKQTTESYYVKLFCISKDNCQYYPWMGRLCYYLFEDERKCCIGFRVVCFYVFFLLFYVWWYLIANFLYKPTEFRQRSKMSQGYDDYLTSFELLLSGTWKTKSILFLIAFIFATIVDIFLAVMMVWPTLWTQSEHFVIFKISYPDPIWKKFNCLHRRRLPFTRTFWKQFWNCLPKPKGLRLLIAIPLGLITLIVSLFPLIDIIFHLPIILQEKRKDGKRKNSDGKSDENLQGISINNKVTSCEEGLAFFGTTVFTILFNITFVAAYIYPTAVVYSMIVSYTITGIMKNWETILPILVFAGIVIFQFVKLVYEAFEPLHKMQVIIYQEYQKKLSDFNKLKAKFEELDDQIDQNGLRFPNFKELILRFPKLNSFIEIRDGHHFLTIPNINELLAVFPDLKGLILNKHGSLFFSVPKLVLSVFEKLILEKGGLYYVKCPEINNKNIKCVENILTNLNGVIQEDGYYYVKVLDHPLEIKLPFETKEIEEFCFKCPDIETITQRFPETKGFIKKHKDKYYMRVQGNLGNIDDAELENYGFWSSEGRSYVQCQFILDYWNKFPKTELITREENGNHTILASFLKHKCYPILERGEFGLKTIFCIAEIVALSLLIAAFGIALYMLNGEKTVGKVVVAIFLTYIPKILNVITKPWHSDVSKIKMEDFVKEKIDEELQRKQNALTLKYILLVLQFYYKDM